MYNGSFFRTAIEAVSAITSHQSIESLSPLIDEVSIRSIFVCFACVQSAGNSNTVSRKNLTENFLHFYSKYAILSVLCRFDHYAETYKNAPPPVLYLCYAVWSALQ